MSRSLVSSTLTSNRSTQAASSSYRHRGLGCGAAPAYGDAADVLLFGVDGDTRLRDVSSSQSYWYRSSSAGRPGESSRARKVRVLAGPLVILDVLADLRADPVDEGGTKEVEPAAWRRALPTWQPRG
ncbi:hypothetical protein HK405_013642, partial [Cladochytrium tenue]